MALSPEELDRAVADLLMSAAATGEAIGPEVLGVVVLVAPDASTILGEGDYTEGLLGVIPAWISRVGNEDLGELLARVAALISSTTNPETPTVS